MYYWNRYNKMSDEKTKPNCQIKTIPSPPVNVNAQISISTPWFDHALGSNSKR